MAVEVVELEGEVAAEVTMVPEAVVVLSVW